MSTVLGQLAEQRLIKAESLECTLSLLIQLGLLVNYKISLVPLQTIDFIGAVIDSRF